MPPFDPNDIRKAITDSLNADVTIPDGHRGALVTVITNSGTQLAVATRLNSKWDVSLIGKHAWTGDNSIGLISRFTW